MNYRHIWRLAAGITLIASGSPDSRAAAAVEVVIAGLSPELERNVRAYLSIDDVQADTDAPPEERRIRQLHAAASDEIAAALRPFGYYAPDVAAELDPIGDHWIARYTVDPGRPVLLTIVDISVVGAGQDDPSVSTARMAIPLAAGQALNHSDYQSAREELYESAYSAGFLDASYQRSELRVRRNELAAEIYLRLDTGPRYYFGDIEIEQAVLDPEFVNRFVSIEIGEPFESDRIVALQIALNDSGYFDDVVVEVVRDRAVNNHIPVLIRASPRQRQEYTIGAGYGTDTGPRIRFGVDLRRIGMHGHRFNMDFRLSTIEQTAAAEYQMPRRNVATDSLAFRSSLGQVEIGDWDTQRLMLGTAWQDDWRGLRRHLYASAQRERFSTDTGEGRIENALYAGMQLIGENSDDPLYPRRGYSWSTDLRSGTDAAIDAVAFDRLHVTGNVVRSFGERLRVLVRTELGAVRSSDFDRLLPSQRFYAGGDGSVRGYGYQALGPRDENGANVGGRYLLRASAELEISIVAKYGAALFFDAGSASNDPRPDLSRGVGIGMRWLSPVGMVGIDIAHPLDDPDRRYRLHLRIGSDL